VHISVKRTARFIVDADPSARYLLNLLQRFIQHPKWWQSRTETMHETLRIVPTTCSYACSSHKTHSIIHLPAS